MGGGHQFMKYLGVEDVKEVLHVSTSKAYEMIKRLNDELSQKGYMVIRGKVPEKYLQERFYG